MKSVVSVFLFFLLFSSEAGAQSSCPTQNHLFLIHGIGGSAKSFGMMEEYLRRLDDCFVVRSFEYETGSSELSTLDFAVKFQEFLQTKIESQEIKSSDKISLIMHSQGGLVGNLWLNLIRETNAALYHQVDAFITLSTPHWGAEIAHVGSHLLFAIPQGFLGKKELNEMSYGSSTIRTLSTLFTQLFRPHNFRPLAIGGIHKLKGRVIGEDDAVVPIYSSRPDHFHAAELISVAQSSGTISMAAFTKTNRVPFVSISATHLKLDLPGIAAIPADCVGPRGCDHPSLPVISNHLRGRSIASVEERLKNFRVSFYLTNHLGQKIRARDVSLEILRSEHVSVPHTQKLTHYRGEAVLEEGIAFSVQGFTQREGIQKILVRLKIHQKFERDIEVPVEGGFSSLLHVTLKD